MSSLDTRPNTNQQPSPSGFTWKTVQSWWSGWSIQRKLGATYLLIFLLIVFRFVSDLGAQQQMNANLGKLADDLLVEQSALNELRTSSLVAQSEAKEYLLGGETESLEEAQEALATLAGASGQLSGLGDDLEEGTEADEEEALQEQLDTAVNNLIAVSEAVFTAVQSSEGAAAQLETLLADLELAEEAVAEALDTWQLQLEAEEVDIFAAIDLNVSQMQRASLVLVLLLTPLIFGLSFFAMRRAINQPLQALLTVSSRIEAGELGVRAPIVNNDEIGFLARQFNTTMSSIEHLLTQNQRVSRFLQLTNEVTQEINQNRLQAQFLPFAAQQIQEKLDLYHVQIYLFDNETDQLRLAASTGAAGQTLLEQGHMVALGRGLVGYTAVSGEPTLVQDVQQNPNWLRNPLLPDTRAEAVFPIIFENELLGVLDMQDNKVGQLSDDLIEPLQSIASTLAVALQNASLLQDRNQALAASEEDKNRIQVILRAIDMPIIITKVADGHVQYINQAFANLFQTSREALVGRDAPDFYATPQDRDAFLARLNEDGALHNYELRLQRPDGSGFWALTSAQTINYLGVPAFMISIIDIEERKHSEELLAKQSAELEIVSKVGVYASTILETEQLLQEAVDLVKKELGLYHAHVYLLNPAGDMLNLFVGAGEVGRHMAAAKRAIPVAREQSLVARAARTRQGVIENDVQGNSAFLPNPLLPDTRAEMAVPMMVNDVLLGVLDVQANEVNYFSQESIHIYTTLTAQLGVAVQNARSFEQMTNAVANLNTLTQRLTEEGWQNYLAQRPEELAYRYNAQEANGHKAKTAVPAQPAPKLAHSLQIQGASIGELQVEAPSAYADDADEILTAVAERLSAHLENLRLTETSEIARANAEKRNEELGLINRMMSSVTSSLNLTGNLEIIAKELADAIDVSHVGIALITDDKQSLQVVTEFPEPADDVIGTLIPIAGNPLTEKAIQSRKFQIAYDAQNNALTEPIHELMRHRGVHALAVVPMIVGDEFFGTIGFDLTDSKRRMNEEQISLAETIVYQAATVVQNARLFSQTQEALAATNEQARRLALLNELSETISRQLSPDEIVATVIDKVTDILDVKRVSLHLIDEEDHTMLRVAGVTGEAADVAHGELIPIEGSPMGDALTTHQIAQGYFSVDDVRFPAIFVPLFVGNQDFGTFNLVLLEHDAELQESDRQIILQLSAVLAAALENQRLFNQTRKRAERERLLNEIVTQVAASLDLQYSLQIIVDEMATALNVDQVRVALIEPDGKQMKIIAEHFDATSPSALGMLVPLEGNELSLEVIATRKMVVVKDAQTNPRTAPVHEMFREQGIETVVLLPLVVNDEVLGTIGLDILDDRSFDPDTLQLAETIVYQAAVAIQNARLFEKSQAALAETETLYAYTSQLNTASNLDAVLDSAAAPGFQVGATDALLLVYDQDASGRAGTGRYMASSPKNIVPLDKPLSLREQPFAKLWPSGGKNSLFVGDITEEQRLSEKDKAAFLADDVHALAIMFLAVGNLRLGQIIIRWQNKQTFTDVDERLYGAIAQQASAVVYNRLLFNQTEEALSETAALYQASVDLNSAGSYEQVLNTLRQHTILGQGSADVSLNFFNRTWEPGDPPEMVDVLARWSTLSSELPNRYRLSAFPEAETVLKPDEWLICSDVATDKRMGKRTRAIFRERFNAKSLVYVPLVVGGQWIGFLNGVYSENREFPEAQIRRLNVLARQAAVSVRSLQLLSQTRRRADREALINSIGQKIQSAPTVEFALQTAVTELSQALKLKKAVVELLPPNGENGQQQESAPLAAEPV